MSVFYWIGVVLVGVVVFAALLIGLVWLYSVFIHGRFELKLFRKTQRRMSIASWHRTKASFRGDGSGDADWHADDFPINERPFYVSYRFGGKRLFLMACVLSDSRWNSIKGTHP